MGVSVREISLKEGGVSFSLDVYFKGQRQQMKTDIQTERLSGREYQKARRQAEAKAADLEAQLKIDPAGVFLGSQKRSSDFIEYFEAITLHEKKSANLYLSTLKHLKDFNKGKPLPMCNVSHAWVELFRAYVDTLELKSTSKANYIQGLKAVLNQAARENLIPDFSRKIKQFRKNEVPLKYLTLDQIKTLEATPCKHPSIRVAFLFACLTGLRISDIRALQGSDIQHDGKRLTIRFKMQKTQKWQKLAIGAQALKYLEEAKALHDPRQSGDDRVFILPRESWCLAVLRAWGAAAGIPFNLSPHCARHSFAVMTLQNGVDIYTLSKLMGHSHISTTEIYAKVVDETKTAAMDKLPSW